MKVHQYRIASRASRLYHARRIARPMTMHEFVVFMSERWPVLVEQMQHNLQQTTMNIARAMATFLETRENHGE